MTNQKKPLQTAQWLSLAMIVVLAVISRLPQLHPAVLPFNVSPLDALALFSGAYFGRKRFAFLLPLACALFSDIIIGFYPGVIFTYAGYLSIYFIGLVIRNNKQFHNILLGSLAGSLLFFLFSNFGCWYSYEGMYPHTFIGLSECYYAGLAFIRNTILGDFAFATVFFGSYYLASRRAIQVQKA